MVSVCFRETFTLPRRDGLPCATYSRAVFLPRQKWGGGDQDGISLFRIPIRQKFGASSEKSTREIAQLEIVLEGPEIAQAETGLSLLTLLMTLPPKNVSQG